MKTFKDIVSGDELFSDAFKMTLVNDMWYEIEGKSVTVSNDINEALIGGNKSAEGADADEGADPSAVTGIDVIVYGRLVETGFNKKSYQTYLKGYMKMLKTKLEESKSDRLEVFVKGAPLMAKTILGMFDNLQFYTGEKMNPDGMAILMNYREDGSTPYFIFFKDGLLEEKQ